MFRPDYRTRDGRSIDDLLEYATDMAEFTERDEDTVQSIQDDWDVNQALTKEQLDLLISIVNKFELEEVAV